MPRRAVIVNVIADDNRGGAALTEAAICAARELLGADASIAVLPTHPVREGSFRHLEASHSATILEPLVTPKIGKVGTLVALAASIWLLAGGKRHFGGVNERSYHAILDADLVVSRGGVILAQRSRRLGDHLRLWFAGVPIALGNRRSVPVLGFGCQIGPVKTRLGRLMLSFILKGTGALLCRGPYSTQLAKDLCEEGTEIIQIPDSVFILPQPVPRERDGITVVIGGEMELGQIIPMMAGAIDEVAKEGAHDVDLLLQVDGQHSSDRKWLDAYIKAGRSIRRVIEADLSVSDYIDELAAARAVVSTRMHSTLLALVSGTPAIAVLIGDDYRKQDVLQGIGFPELVVKAEGVGSKLQEVLGTPTNSFDELGRTSKASLREALYRVKLVLQLEDT